MSKSHHFSHQWVPAVWTTLTGGFRDPSVNHQYTLQYTDPLMSVKPDGYTSHILTTGDEATTTFQYISVEDPMESKLPTEPAML